jgi:hypothetical protein
MILKRKRRRRKEDQEEGKDQGGERPPQRPHTLGKKLFRRDLTKPAR